MELTLENLNEDPSIDLEICSHCKYFVDMAEDLICDDNCYLYGCSHIFYHCEFNLLPGKTGECDKYEFTDIDPRNLSEFEQ